MADFNQSTSDTRIIELGISRYKNGIAITM